MEIVKTWDPKGSGVDNIGIAAQMAKKDTLRDMVQQALGSAPRIFVLDRTSKETEGFGEMIDAIPHSWFTKDHVNADFVIAGCYTRYEHAETLLQLPQRPGNRPYVVWTLGLHLPANCIKTRKCPYHKELVHRGDVIFLALDLRGYDLQNNAIEPLPGATMSPPLGAGRAEIVTSRPKYFLTFQGTNNAGMDGSSRVRLDLQKSFAGYTARKDVFVRIFAPGVPFPSNPSYDDLMDTAYILVPHGHGRWSYRFSEVLRFCIIPVIMADGLTLPFEELIDYEGLVLFRPEEMAKNPQQLIDSLPADMEAIQARRKRVCEIHKQHFATLEKRSSALFRSALVFLAKQIKKGA